MKKIRATAAFLCTLLFAVGIFALQIPGTQPNSGQTGASQSPQASQPPQMTPSPQNTPSVPPGQSPQSPSQGPGHASNIDDQVKILSSELNLTADQQEKVKSILTDQHQQAMSVVQDNSVSREDKLTKIHSLRETTISKVRQTLAPDQQPKFDQMIENMHQRQEGGSSPSGATPPAGNPPTSSTPPQTPPTAGKPPQ
ncbi:MAG TPA: hypothetical protein VI636_15280 [Candidatus Angelobacter sp.]